MDTNGASVAWMRSSGRSMLLDAFRSAPGSLSLADLAAKTGLFKSTILRLFVSLERIGYLSGSTPGASRSAARCSSSGNVYRRRSA